MQRAAGNGFQQPQLVHRHGQIGAVLRVPDARFQPVLQGPGLLTVRQGFRLGQLLVQLVQPGILRSCQVLPQRLDQFRHLALLPVLGHGVGGSLAAHAGRNAVLQPRQLVHSLAVQGHQVRQLGHLGRLHDQPLLHILALLGPQHHLVQLGRVRPDAPFQLVRLPGVPGPLHPVLGYFLRNSNVLVPLLAGHFQRNGVPLGLFLLPGFPPALVFGLPLHDLVVLDHQRALRPVGPALLLLHLVGQVVVFFPQLAHAFLVPQLCRVHVFLPLGFQPLLLLLQLPAELLPLVGDVLVHVAQVGKGLSVDLHSAPGLGALVGGQSAGKLLPLHFLDTLHVLLHLGGPCLVSGRRLGHLQRLLLHALKNGLGVGHLGHVHNVLDHPPGQLHPGILVLGLVRKAAAHLRLNAVMQIHQHVQPLGALHAHDTLHTSLLGRRFPQRPRTVLDAAHGPGVVHNALVLLRRVAVPHALGLPQGHTVAAGLGHRRAPAAVLLHQLVLGLAVFVHGVLQPMQFRVFVPQLAVAVGRPVQHFARQRFGQRLGLCHVRTVRFQVVHQHPGLVRQLHPVGPAGVGFRPPRRQPVQAVLAHLHTPRHPKQLAQGVQCRRRVRNIPACLPLVVLLCLPAGLLRQLETELCKAAFLRQLSGLVILPDLPHHLVRIHTPAVFLAGGNPAVCCGDVQRELPALAAQLLGHFPDLFQLLRRGGRVRRNVHARCLGHHTHIAVQQKLIQSFRAVLHFRRAEHLQNFPVVGVPATVILGKVQHLAVRQNVPCPPELFRHAELLLRQHPPVLRIAAVRFGSGIVGVLCILGLGVLPLLQTLIGCFHLLRQGAVPLFQRGQAAVVLLALCKVVLVFCAVPVGLALCGKNAQRLFLCLDPLHFGTVQPCTAFFLQGTALLGQLLLFGAQLCQLILLRQLIAHIFLHSCIVFLAFGRGLCYSSVRRYFLSIRKGAPHSFRELCGSIFFFCHISLSVKRHIASICPAYLMNIEILHAILPGVFSYNHAFIQLCSVNFDGRCKDISIIPSSLPVLLIPDLLSFLNYFGDCSNRNLFCFAVPMLHRCTCTALCQLHRSEVFTNHFVSYRIKEFFNIGNVFVSRFSERHLCSFDCRHRFYFFQFVQMAVHLLHQRIFSLVQLEPPPPAPHPHS